MKAVAVWGKCQITVYEHRDSVISIAVLSWGLVAGKENNMSQQTTPDYTIAP